MRRPTSARHPGKRGGRQGPEPGTLVTLEGVLVRFWGPESVQVDSFGRPR